MIESDLYRSVASIRCDRSKLDAIKSRYESDIGSRRRYEAIRTLSDLLKILTKRDCLSLTNIEPLIEIGSTYGNTEILRLINNYKGNNANPVVLEPPPEAVGIQQSTDAKTRAYRLIAEEIGRTWKDFARALDIREGRIEELEQREPRISERTYKILYQYEDNCDTRRFQSGILNALEKARRFDLKNAVQEIFDIH